MRQAGIAHQEPSQEGIAERQHISSRTLQRKLVIKDSRYRIRVGEVHQDITTRLEANTDLNFTDIAYPRGFRDASHFSRVFRHWHGATPSQFRSDKH